MQYLDTQFRILRYFAKVKRSGKIGLAWLRCLKPIGNDYTALVDIQNRINAGEKISDIIDRTDAQFDITKVRDLFVEQGICTKAQFTAAVLALRSANYLRADSDEADDTAVTKWSEIEQAYEASRPFIKLPS